MARPRLRLPIRRTGLVTELLPNIRTVAVACAVSAIVFSACGGDEDNNEVAAGPTVDIPQDTAPAPSPGLQTQPEPVQQLDEQASLAADGIIEIVAAELKFAPNRWRMTLGDTVTIRIANADGQQHNLRLAGLDGEYDTDDDALTLPDAIAPGETGDLTFVPEVDGNYTFRCDFHPGSMGGRIEVE